jgi:hypothetical protein
MCTLKGSKLIRGFETKSVTISELLQLGGNTGLFLGFSFVSILELWDLLLALAAKTSKPTSKKKNSQAGAKKR